MAKLSSGLGRIREVVECSVIAEGIEGAASWADLGFYASCIKCLYTT